MGLERFVSHKNQFHSNISNEINFSSILAMAFAKCTPFSTLLLLLLVIVVSMLNDECFISSFGNRKPLYAVMSEV